MSDFLLLVSGIPLLAFQIVVIYSSNMYLVRYIRMHIAMYILKIQLETYYCPFDNSNNP